MSLTCEEALFGGAAGGGKSDAGLMAALQHIAEPGYSAGIFRRTKIDLLMPDAILARAHGWFQAAREAGECRWDDDSNTYFFRTKPGKAEASIHFGYFQHEKDKLRYQGSRFHFVFIDELGQWSENHYRYLFSRIRRSKSEAQTIPLRMRASANPGGPGHSWVKARFVEHARHITAGSDVREDLKARSLKRLPLPSPRVYQSPASEEAREAADAMGVEPEGAYFVPAFADDNPGLDAAAYRGQLARLDPVTRQWLEHGNWDAQAGGKYFNAECFDYVDAPPEGVLWIRSWDFAATDESEVKARGGDPDFSAGAKCGFWFPMIEGKRINQPRFVVADMRHGRWGPGETQREVVGCAKADGRRVPVLIEQEGGASGKQAIHSWQTQSLVGFRVHGMRKTGPKSEYWGSLSRFAATQPILLVRGTWVKGFTDEMTSLPVGHDDRGDSVSQAFSWLSEGGNALARVEALS